MKKAEPAVSLWNTSISAPDKKQSLASKAYDKLESSWILPRWLERRNLWWTKAHVAWVAKWAYDTVAQWTRDLWALATYLWSKWLLMSDEKAWDIVNKYYDATKFVDKPDEALVNYAYDQATPAVAKANLDRWEWEWEAAALLSSVVWLSSPSEAVAAERAVKSLLKNPWKYSKAEALNIIRNRAAVPSTTTEKVMQSVGKWTENLLQKIWQTKLFKAWDKAQVEKAAKELWVDLDTLTKPAKNTSKARAEATMRRNLPALEREAAEAEKSVRTQSLEDMFKEWKSQQNG